MALVVLNGPIIQAGESLSDPLDCSAGEIVRITMPGAWDGAALTFQASTDGILFNDLYFPNGEEVAMQVRPGAGVLLNAMSVLAVEFLKVRSGTSKSPVPQSMLREFAVSLKTDAAATEEPPAESETRVEHRKKR